MKKGFKIGLSIAIAFLFFLMIRDGRDEDSNFQLQGNSYMEGIQIIQKDNGKALWTLYAKRADFCEGEEKADLTDMSMVMPKNDIVLSTERGVYSLSDKRFMAKSAVKARAREFIITADSIDYDVSAGSMKSDGRVELDSEKIRIEGRGFETANGRKITVYDDVKATFYQ